ncbi:hypothetical protein C1645_877582 [Glomus cerebriforme]|uniref:Uncharacterized protein n=1 Tax=Glomus cerebriforme TaxID=658196 RepID=A0A397SUA4_9GLOM|nr:hypothetical protein C1645_877582 [Glomus cerebriforme]
MFEIAKEEHFFKKKNSKDDINICNNINTRLEDSIDNVNLDLFNSNFDTDIYEGLDKQILGINLNNHISTQSGDLRSHKHYVRKGYNQTIVNIMPERILMSSGNLRRYKTYINACQHVPMARWGDKLSENLLFAIKNICQYDFIPTEQNIESLLGRRN